MLNKIDDIIEDASAGILATTDSGGNISMRWMTPVIISNRPGSLFAVSAPNTAKIQHLQANNNVQWMIQTRDLREIVSIKGVVNIIDNPALTCEITDIIGSKLAIFWKANTKAQRFVVLETVITEATYFKPMEGTRQIVRFVEEAQGDD